MAAITPNTITNGVVLEFDFIATGDTLNFKYMFASEEYPNDYGTSFYDVFGFFISGPGFAGPYLNGGVNIATLPGTTTPISILNLNPTTNSAYYVDNVGGAAYGNSIQYDGTSIVFTAAAQLQCGQEYHIKLGISNVGDQSLDSGVFLEAESFSSNLVNLSTNSSVSNSFSDSLLAEGCTYSTLLFVRPSVDTIVADTIPLIINGTVDPLTDLTSAFTDTVYFPVGVDSVTLVIDPLADGMTEPIETIEIGFYNITICGDSIYDSILLYITNEYDLQWTHSDTLITNCIATDQYDTISNFSNSIPPFTVLWDFGSTDTISTLPHLGNNIDTMTYFVTIQDGCGANFYDSVTYISNQTLVIDSMTQNPSSSCIADGVAFAHIDPSNITGIPNFNFTGPGANSPNQWNGSTWIDIPSGWYYFTITDNVCTANDSVFVEQNNPPIANLDAIAVAGCDPIEVVFTNSSENSSTYLWDFGDGTSFNVSDLSGQTHTFSSSSQVMLVAYDVSSCSDTAYVDINVIACGCTDPNAENYDPNAVQNDGSCTYPVPAAFPPNVITPNGDGQNDVFFIRTENTVKLELVIVNRWGNVLYDQNIDILAAPTAGWDGTLKNGNEAGEGTYFYRYVATGVNGDEVEGHGFLQLVRD